MKSTEKSSPLALACFNLDDLPFFHTGDVKNCVVPDSINEFDESNYGRIRFHLFLTIKGMDLYLFQKTDHTESSFSTLIEYSAPFTYEYMELHTLTKFAEKFLIPIVDIRFLKMEYVTNDRSASELHYYLLGLVDENQAEMVKTNFDLVTKYEIHSQLEKDSIWVEVVQEKDKIYHNLQPEKKTGLIIGRFQPVHLGHLYLFKKALEKVDCLIIGIGSSQTFDEPKNPFTYEERKKMIETALLEENIPASRFKIYPIPDKFNFAKWIKSIFEIVEEFDVLFTNNLWIGRLLQQKGKSLEYGLKYNFKQYNGTFIRTLLKNGDPVWKTLVPSSIIPFIEESKRRLT